MSSHKRGCQQVTPGGMTPLLALTFITHPTWWMMMKKTDQMSNEAKFVNKIGTHPYGVYHSFRVPYAMTSTSIQGWYCNNDPPPFRGSKDTLHIDFTMVDRQQHWQQPTVIKVSLSKEKDSWQIPWGWQNPEMEVHASPNGCISHPSA